LPFDCSFSWLGIAAVKVGPILIPEDSPVTQFLDAAFHFGFFAFRLLPLPDLEHPELSMIVEIPDPACDGACASARELDIVRARDSFTKAFGEPVKRFQHVSETLTVTVIGVGFFDFKHKQTGLAPNGIELHPLIGFEVNNASRL
jgi:hypothetical protein